MLRESEEYVNYISKINEIKKPPMPKYSLKAYNDDEYLSAISGVMDDFENLDCYSLTLEHLRDDDGN